MRIDVYCYRSIWRIACCHVILMVGFLFCVTGCASNMELENVFSHQSINNLDKRVLDSTWHVLEKQGYGFVEYSITGNKSNMSAHIKVTHENTDGMFMSWTKRTDVWINGDQKKYVFKCYSDLETASLFSKENRRDIGEEFTLLHKIYDTLLNDRDTKWKVICLWE